MTYLIELISDGLFMDDFGMIKDDSGGKSLYIESDNEYGPNEIGEEICTQLLKTMLDAYQKNWTQLYERCEGCRWCGYGDNPRDKELHNLKGIPPTSLTEYFNVYVQKHIAANFNIRISFMSKNYMTNARCPELHHTPYVVNKEYLWDLNSNFKEYIKTDKVTFMDNS